MGVVNYPFISLEEEATINAPETFPGIDMDHPWIYKGWRIWRWTGWKGNWSRRNPVSESAAPICKECGRAIEMWDIVYMCQSVEGVFHAECKPEYEGGIAGQWLAIDRKFINGTYPFHDPTVYAYSSAPGSAGIYHRGECFDIGEFGTFTYYTPLEELEAAKEEALERLKALIDQEVARG